MRLPFEPLERYVFLNTQPINEDVNERVRTAAHIGASVDTVTRWRTQGVPFFQADRAAIRLGTHPCMIWPNWFDVEPIRPPIEHGTANGLRQHHEQGVPTCEPCRAARAWGRGGRDKPRKIA